MYGASPMTQFNNLSPYEQWCILKQLPPIWSGGTLVDIQEYRFFETLDQEKIDDNRRHYTQYTRDDFYWKLIYVVNPLDSVEETS